MRNSARETKLKTGTNVSLAAPSTEIEKDLLE